MARTLRPLARVVHRQSRNVSSETKLTVLPNQMRVATGTSKTRRTQLSQFVARCPGPCRAFPAEVARPPAPPPNP